MAAEKKKRTDAERRLRQSERLSRVIRTLRCVMGPGRWDKEALARELEVSERTVQRIMQTLEFAGIPLYNCKESKCYRIRPGFKFPPLESGASQSEDAPPLNSKVLLTQTQRMIAEGEKFVAALRDFQEVLEGRTGPRK
jgi:hypothetical protein